MSELGYRPTSSGSRLSTFKGSSSDWNDKNNSVSSVNSRTSERLLAVQFQLTSNSADSNGEKKLNNDQTEEDQVIELGTEDEFEEDQQTFDNGLNLNGKGSPALANPLYLGLTNCSTGQDHLYENGEIVNCDEPIYENVEGSNETVLFPEPLYDTVPRRPKVPPKPDLPARTLSGGENENPSNESVKSDNLSSENSDHLNNEIDDVSGDSLSAESLSDSTSQDCSKIAKRRKRKPRETNEQTLIVDGSETSDLGSSGSEDVACFEEWPSTLPSALVKSESTVELHDVLPIQPQNPELALQKLEEEVLAEVQREKSLALEPSHSEKNISESKEDSSIQAINSSIIQVGRSRDEIDEAKIIDDENTSSSSDDVSSVPAIRHSVIIELKDSAQSTWKTEQKVKNDLRRSGSLNFTELDTNVKVKKVKSSIKKKNRRVSETGLGSGAEKKSVETNGISKLLSNSKAKQVIKIGEVSNDLKLPKSGTASTQSNYNNLKGQKTVKMNKFGEPIAAPPSYFMSTDGSDGVFSASCVALSSAPNSLASSNDSSTSIEIYEVTESVEQNLNSPTKKKVPFWYDEPSEALMLGSVNPNNKKNIGYAIMESYEKELSKKKESLNLPEVSMVDFGGVANDLEIDRKNVIRQMIVKTKKKDSWFNGVSATDLDANVIKRTPAPAIKRSNSMSSATPKVIRNSFNARSASHALNKDKKSADFLLNMKKSVSKSHVSDDESEDFVFPSFMKNEDTVSDGNLDKTESESSKKYFGSPPKPDPLPDFSSIELTIKKLGIDQTSHAAPPYIINRHLTSITPFKLPSQNKHSQIKTNIKSSSKTTIVSVTNEDCLQSFDAVGEAHKLSNLQTALHEANEKLNVKKLNISHTQTTEQCPISNETTTEIMASTEAIQSPKVTKPSKEVSIEAKTTSAHVPQLTKENVEKVSQAAEKRGE